MQLTINLRLTPTVEGGRPTPIVAGYRSCWDNGDTIGGAIHAHDAPILIVDPDPLPPGESGVAVVQPIRADGLGWEHVRVGDVLTMHEGARLCGYATVIAIEPGAFDEHWSFGRPR